LSLVLKRGLIIAAVGTGLGAGGALALTGLLRNLLFDVQPSDPVTFVAVVLILGVVAFAASYLPARRAMKVDPIIALRYE
jgi:ABC-type antimicrobial peptide transport system permease subunit